MDSKSHLLAPVITLLEATGDWLKSQSMDTHELELQAHNAFISQITRESERRIQFTLSMLFPDAGFISEETWEDGYDYSTKEYNWAISPLGGTNNFLRNIPFWSLSIALLRNGEPIIAAIYDPNHNEMFYASKFGGAFMNGKRIFTSKMQQLSTSLLVTGFPYDEEGRLPVYLKLFEILTLKSRGLRRLGSVTLNLAWVATGRFDAFYEYSLKPWDVAAGFLLVNESGGQVTGMNDNNPIFSGSLIASNKNIHQELHVIIQENFVKRKLSERLNNLN